MFSCAHLWDELFDDDVEHRAGGEGEEIREHGYDEARREDREEAADGFDEAGEHADAERFRARLARRAKRHRDDRALWEILDGDADGERERRAGRDVAAARHPTREHDADSHALGDVVERDGKRHHDGLREMARGALGLVAAIRLVMEMRDDVVEEQQKQRANPKADNRRHECEVAEVRAFLHRGDEQAPDGCREHDAGRKAEERLLYVMRQLFLHEQHARRAERRAEERNREPFEDDGGNEFMQRKDLPIEKLFCVLFDRNPKTPAFSSARFRHSAHGHNEMFTST